MELGNGSFKGRLIVDSCTDRRAELACLATALAPEERRAHFALIAQLFGKLAQEQSDLPDGYAYRFKADALEAVAQFVARERKCCPFLTFQLTVAAGSGPLWLRMTGPEGAREILETELEVSSRSRAGTGWNGAAARGRAR